MKPLYAFICAHSNLLSVLFFQGRFFFCAVGCYYEGNISCDGINGDAEQYQIFVEYRALCVFGQKFYTYIDVLPALARHWPDGRIRYKLNSVGTDTGRFSSGGEFKFLDGDDPVEISGFNSQNIPSRGDGKITRLLFEAKKEFEYIEVNVDRFTVHETAELETADGWKYGKDIVALKDSVLTDEGPALVEVVSYDITKREYEFIVRKY